MEFDVGQVFTDSYPPEAAEWCNSRRKYYIEEIGSAINDSGKKVRRFHIVAAPLPTQEDLATQVRTARDRRLEACTWIVERHRDQLDAGEVTTLTVEEYQVWLAYRQALRDLPQQAGFPWTGPDNPQCPWPDEPRG